MRATFFILLLVAAVASTATSTSTSSTYDDDGSTTSSEYLDLMSNGEGEACSQAYGFIPCSETWKGNVFLILVYGYFMYTAATYLYNGCELLLEIVGPGIVGGLLIPVLGALPDSLLILVSGLFGSRESAQSQVSVGMGLLAGSTVIILTLIWGSCVLVGKCDLHHYSSRAIDESDTKGFSLTGSGVSTDIWTSYAAMIMVVSVISFLVVQIPQALPSTSAKRLALLVALTLSFALLLTYCLYQVFQPWIQERHLSYVKHRRLISGFLGRLRMRALGKLTHDDGTLNHHAVEKLFCAIDVDGDKYLVKSELRAFLIGTQLDEMVLDEDDLVDKVMHEFDVEQADSKITLTEFKAGISKWIDDVRQEKPGFGDDNMMNFLIDVHQESIRQHALLGGEGDILMNKEGDENTKKPTIRAILMLLIGTVIAAAFADPLVGAVENFSDATNIPSFFISFIVLPLATNSSVAMSAIIFSSRKKIKSASLTFSELYGAVTMNNVLCLPVFLALVYFRELTWDFTSEVLIILVVCVVIGLMGCLRTTFPLWTSLVAFALYPLSLLLVYVLDYICGWS